MKTTFITHSNSWLKIWIKGLLPIILGDRYSMKYKHKTVKLQNNPWTINKAILAVHNCLFIFGSESVYFLTISWLRFNSISHDIGNRLSSHYKIFVNVRKITGISPL